jgi:hypothetical protein
MEGTARTWFTPKQKAELWERWRAGTIAASIGSWLSMEGLPRAPSRSWGRNVPAQFPGGWLHRPGGYDRPARYVFSTASR